MNDAGTLEWHTRIIKSQCFRAKVYSDDPCVVTVKVSSRRAKIVLDNYFGKHGIVGIFYKIQILGWFECWFPRYQIMEID